MQGINITLLFKVTERVTSLWGGSLCKVQDDKILLPRLGEGCDGEYPARGLFIQFLTKCSTMRFRVAARNEKKEKRHSVLDTESPTLGWDYAPSPDWGRLGWGEKRKASLRA